MKLKQYLKVSKQTQNQFIDAAYVLTGHKFPQGTLAKYCIGQRIPRAKEMSVIYRVTNQQVTPNDFYLEE